MNFDRSDVQNFCEKILAMNRKLFPELKTFMKYPITNSDQLQDVKWVGLYVWFYDESVGDSDHVFSDDEYDSTFMHCRVRTRIALYNQHQMINHFDQTLYTSQPLLADTTANDVAQTVEALVSSFILPKLIKLGLPISKDSWLQG